MSGTDEREILRRRAQALARPAQQVGVLETGTHLVLPAGSERLAVPLTHVERVLPLGQGWSRLPGAPPHIAGLVTVRGRLLPLTDPLPLLGIQGQEPGPGSHGVVVAAAGGAALVPRTVLLCGGRPWETTLPTEELEEPPDTVPQDVRPFLAGVAPGLVTVVDLERLLEDPRILAGPDGGRR